MVSTFSTKCFSNFIESIKIIATGTDGIGWNSYKTYGITYIISLPFTIIGIIRSIKSNKNINKIFNIWFISSLITLFFFIPNINRINIIIIPIIYYSILGLDFITTKFIITYILLGICYLTLFVDFIIEYCITDWNNFSTFQNQVENVIEYVDKLKVDKIYFDYSFKETYIYVLFYTKVNPHEFANTVKYRENATYERVKSFGKYEFYSIEEIKNTNLKEAYVIPIQKAEVLDIEEDIWNKIYINNFVVLQEKV